MLKNDESGPDFGDVDDNEEGQIDEYDLTSSPNDFNVTTLVNFIDSGVVRIPGFQRHYVWDIKRASKLIESLIIGLPVPQIFQYEYGKNDFLVIDGQQRLMTIYYFVKGRFPKKDRRARLRRVFNEYGNVPDAILDDSDFFEPFRLRLPARTTGNDNKFEGLDYSSLDEYKTQFDLRTIRNVIIKQVKPRNDDSSIYEIFNRLNAGGVLLTPQEIRLSLYHSSLFEMLFRVNLDDDWRAIIGEAEPDLHMRDIEVLLRSIALLHSLNAYSGSMVRFLNDFSKKAQEFPSGRVDEIEKTVNWFISKAKVVDPKELQTRTSRFGVTLFEALFVAACQIESSGEPVALTTQLVKKIKADPTFQSHSQQKTTHTVHVTGRIRRVQELIREASR